MEELIENAIKEAKLRMDVLPFWQQEALQRIIKEAAEQAYIIGRKDQKYHDKGPIRMY